MFDTPRSPAVGGALTNSLTTGVLLAGLGGLIIAVAGLIGGGSAGAFVIGLAIALVMVGGSSWFSDRLALRAARAKVIERHDHPQFYGMVESLAHGGANGRRMARLFSTHPATDERIRRLRAMSPAAVG